MNLEWKSFRVHLPSFCEFLLTNISGVDGIVANSEFCIIIELSPFTQEDEAIINSYYDSLTEEGEAAKFKPELNLDVFISKDIQLRLILKGIQELTPDEVVTQEIIDDCIAKVENIIDG